MRPEARANRYTILRALYTPKTIKEVTAETGLSKPTVHAHIQQLHRDGQLTATKHPPLPYAGRPPTLYHSPTRAALRDAIRYHPGLGEALMESPGRLRPSSP